MSRIAILLIICATFCQSNIAESIFKVYPTTHGYNVAKESSNEIIYSNTDASETIQFAINNTTKGEVLLLSGCYYITKPIYLRNDIELLGKGRGTELRLEDANEKVVIFKEVNNSKLSYMAISAGTSSQPHSTGIFIDNSSEILVEEVLIVGFKDYGINAISSAGISIKGGHVIDNDLGNIHFSKIESGQNGNEILNTILLWGGGGVYCEDVENVTINSCVIQQINGVSLELGGKNIAVSKCRTFYTESIIADVILKGSEIKISNNIFCWGRGDGVLVDGAKKVVITENNIIDHGTPPGNDIYKSGILLKNGAEEVDVRGNAIFNWDDMSQGPMLYGIEEKQDCKNNYFAYNTIQFYKNVPILSIGSGTVAEYNAADPGEDDLRWMPDFQAWRRYIVDFIHEKVLNSEVSYWNDSDFVITTDGRSIIVKSLVNHDILLKTRDAATAIQWAIDKGAPYGGSIEIAAGHYNINRTIIVKKNIWLKGEGEATVLNALGSNGIDACIRMEDAPQSRVSDIKLVQSGEVATGIEIYKSVTGKITNVKINGFRKYGIDFAIDYTQPEITWGNRAISSLVEVRNCVIANSRLVNINIPQHGGYIGNGVPNLISKNTILGGGIGIYCKAICTNVVDNIIVNTRGVGFVMDQNSILNSGNIFYRCGESAVVAYDGKQSFRFHPEYDRQDNNNNKECNITRNWIIDTKGHGIEVSEKWGTVSSNVIINSGVGSGQRYGIWLHEDTDSYCVYNNKIFNSNNNFSLQYGIRENGFNNLIAKNLISGYRVKGVLSKGDQTVVYDNTTKNKNSNRGTEWKFDDEVTFDMDFKAIEKYIFNTIKPLQIKLDN